jgi:hypothetical protein
MERLVWPTPIHTRIIRTPAAGPEPANTLVYLECRTAGFDSLTHELGTTGRAESEFATEFRLDGYKQSRHEWYLENTIVSATVMLRALNTDTDLSFLIAVDRIEPILGLDGTLSFVCEIALRIDDEAWFPPNSSVTVGAALSAYVLCWEPRADVPPSGRQRGSWATRFRPEVVTISHKHTNPTGADNLASTLAFELPAKRRHRPRRTPNTGDN